MKKTEIFRSQCAGCAFADIILLFSVWASLDTMWVCVTLEDVYKYMESLVYYTYSDFLNVEALHIF